MNIHFLEPNKPNVLREKLIELFKTDNPLLIAVAYFNNKIFADLIIERFHKKQQTFLLLNTSDLIRPQEIGESEIAISAPLMNVILTDSKQDYIHIRTRGIRTKGKYQNMHHKFFLSKKELFFGSMNLTHAALNTNYESVLHTYDKRVIHQFHTEFEKLWNSGVELSAGSRYNELRILMCPECEISDHIDFESFGPICFGCGHKFSIK